jgi:hypothetical protein
MMATAMIQSNPSRWAMVIDPAVTQAPGRVAMEMALTLTVPLAATPTLALGQAKQP